MMMTMLMMMVMTTMMVMVMMNHEKDYNYSGIIMVVLTKIICMNEDRMDYDDDNVDLRKHLRYFL